MRWLIVWWALAGMVTLDCAGQTSPPLTLQEPARAWAVRATQNESATIDSYDVYLRYRVHISGPKGNQVRDVIESKDGTVARLVTREGKTLTPEEDAAEHDRLQSMIDSPAAFARHIKGDQSGKKLASDLVRLMPDAMSYNYAPGQPQRARSDGRVNDQPEVVLDFTPNPSWHPPTMTAEALTGLRGRVWIDPRTQHLTRLEAEVFRGVSVGWGIVAHINPGGRFVLEQVAATPQRWIISHFMEDVSLRALLVKSFTETRTLDCSDYSQVAGISYQNAIKMLLNTPLPR